MTDKESMFCGATEFNQDITSWDVAKVTNMECMFYGARTFNQVVSSWAVSGLIHTYFMFDPTTAFEIKKYATKGYHQDEDEDQDEEFE